MPRVVQNCSLVHERVKVLVMVFRSRWKHVQTLLIIINSVVWQASSTVQEERTTDIDDRAVGVKDRKAAACKMHTCTKIRIRNNSLQKIFVHLIFVGGVTHENFITTKIFQSMVLHPILTVECLFLSKTERSILKPDGVVANFVLPISLRAFLWQQNICMTSVSDIFTNYVNYYL